MSVSRSRRLTGTGSLFLVAIVAGCSESGQTPLAPSDKPQLDIQALVVTTTGWDFTALIGTLAGCQDWGASKLVTQAPFGSINLTTGDAGDGVPTLTSKGLELGVGDTERGLGLALTNPCNGDEVGDGGDGFLFMDFNGVLAAGSTLTQVDLGSVQGSATASTQEGWEIWYSTTGLGDGTTGYLLLSKGFGDGVNNAADNITLTGAPLPLATANLVLRFQKNEEAPGNATTDNDYVVKSVTTAFEEEVDLGCTLTQGYWKTHAFGRKDAWPVAGLTIGGIFYTKAQLVAIMEAPTAGNGLMSLVQQLVAAKLNVIEGASDADIADEIAAADAMIDAAGGAIVIGPPSSPFIAPATSSALNEALTAFNEGNAGVPHCDD